ncbi:MAG TPA: hypothetical protein VFR09_02310 [Alphaproteobacteria bacterium]|nr:hypothetical protein [Alphaproteobacteria bacterium]
MATSPTVAIALPTGDMVHADFAVRLATMCLNPGARTCIINAKTSLIALGRNQCAEAAKLAGATHMLFLDSDMVFPLDTIARLLKHDKDVVGAVYSQRRPPFHPLGMTIEGEHIHVTQGLQKMKIIPTGCMMIKLSVFDKLPKPWFTNGVEDGKILGEDYYFCEQARKAGFDIWCDGDLSREVGHIGQTTHYIDAAQRK